MAIDPTNYRGQIEPTQQAHNNPYMPQDPYYEFTIPIPPPPPPPSHNRRNFLFITIMLLGGLIVFGAVRLLIGPTGYQTRTSSTPSSTIQPHDAMAIIQDFQAQNLPLDDLSYGVAITQFTGSSYNTVITVQSSATFIDPSFCDGSCDAGSVWLGVYRSSIDAQSEYNGLIAYDNGSSSQVGSVAFLVQAGHCLLIGEPATSEYAAIFRNDCT